MNKNKAIEVKYILQDLEDVEEQLKTIDRHTFGFGTSFKDIDDYLRPIVIFYLNSKKEKLLSKLKDY